MMKKTLLWLLSISTTVSAADFKLSDWYVSRGASVEDWIGNYEVASKSPEQWAVVDDWEMNSSHRFMLGDRVGYAMAILTADEEYGQGFSVSHKEVEVRLNGKLIRALPRSAGVLRNLPLKKGENTLEIRIPCQNLKRFADVVFSRAELEYIYPTLTQRYERAALAISYLGEKYPDYPAKELLEKMNALKGARAGVKEVEAFRYEALVDKNPEFDFDEILYRVSGTARLPINWQGNSAYTHRAGEKHRPNFDDSFEVLNLKTREKSLLYKPESAKEGLMDICLDYSGKKFLYSGVEPVTGCFELFEMNMDGTEKRQITAPLPEVDNYGGVYLPDGKILFSSSRAMNSVPCTSGRDYAGIFYVMNPDGPGIRQVNFDQENNWYPWVKDNGKVMYLRWEYTDNSHYFTRILMEMNPDGSNNRSIYGSNSYWPNTLFYAKQIPGKTSMFSAIVSGHHGIARVGELWLFDHNLGDFEGEGVLRKIPGRGKTYELLHRDRYADGKWPMFVHPFPLSENFFLVSAKRTPISPHELFLVDTFDNMVPLMELPRTEQLFEPIPIKPRQTPPVIPDRHNPDAENATIFIQDIYEGPGLKGVPKGTVDAIRIFTYGYAYRDTGSHDVLAVEGGWDTKRILGTVPVESDGSTMFNVPHSMPISLQPLDKDGNALQLMRSWIAPQAGERLSCVGCHEPSRTPPLSTLTLASKKPPREITPWSKVGRIYGYGFNREIQPILDRFCVGCHDGSNPKLPNFKDTSEWTRGGKIKRVHFSKSYLALHPYVRRPGPESDLHILTPLEYHTSTSELFQMLEKGHHGVKLDDASMRELATWVDLNVPYIATWLEYKDDEHSRDMARRTMENKKQFAGLDDDIEWMPPALSTRPEFVSPKKPPARPAPHRLKGWPLGKVTTPEKRRIEIADGFTMEFVRIPKGKFVMGSVDGADDEFPQAVIEIKKPFWMSVSEITNEQFRKFNPGHDSRFVDQQWKDHIYAGYPADEPQMPAVRVSWKESMAFCNWLSEKTGLGFTLPTEAQWEWAARAGSDRPFFFGNTGFEMYANLADAMIADLAVSGINPMPVPIHARSVSNDFVPRDDSFNDGRLIPDGVAQYRPNSWGLYDMHGNVAEWTRSSYVPYPYQDDDGRNDLSQEERKVARGGSWRDRPFRATSSYRLGYQSYQKVANTGIRLVIEE